MRKLLIVDPTLVSLEGHSYNYDRAIFGAARAHFDEVVLYTGRGFRAPPGDDLVYRPILNRLPLERLKRTVNAVFHLLGRKQDASAPPDAAAVSHATVVPNVWHWLIHLAKRLRARDLEASLRQILSEHTRSDPGDLHVFLQHVHLHDLLVADRLRGNFAGQAAAVHLDLVLRYSPELVNAGYLRDEDFAALLVRISKSAAPQVHLLTDSERLSAEYRALGVNRVTTLPVPILLPESETSVDSGTAIEVSFLGSSRVEKGFCELPALLRALPHDVGGREIRAAVQITRDSTDPRVRAAVEDLRVLQRASPESLELLDSPVSMRVYYDWVARSGIMALPYLSQKYNASTSGIFVEAICFGVPVLCPANSWMSDMIEEAQREHGLRIGEVFTGLEQIPAIVGNMASDLARYRADVKQFSAIWRQTHNPESCVKVLLSATA